MRSCHALLRAMERCPGVCPGVLIRGLNWAVKHRRSDVVQLLASLPGDGIRELYRFRLADGQPRFLICCAVTGYVITILAPGHHVRTHHGLYRLGERGLEEIPQEKTERKER